MKIYIYIHSVQQYIITGRHAAPSIDGTPLESSEPSARSISGTGLRELLEVAEGIHQRRPLDHVRPSQCCVKASYD